jgi:flagellar basal body-associated protein FliL
MADEHKAPASGAAPAAAPAAVPAAKGALGGLIGMLAAGAVLVLVGAGSGLYVAKLFQPAPAKAGEEAHAEAHSSEHGGAVDPATTKEMSLGELITNIANQEGRRYVKVSCAIWISAEDAHHLEAAEGEGSIQIKKVVQMALEEQLKRYEMADLTSRGIISALSQDFQVVIENTLHAQFPAKPKDYRFVKKVILNNMLVQ